MAEEKSKVARRAVCFEFRELPGREIFIAGSFNDWKPVKKLEDKNNNGYLDSSEGGGIFSIFDSGDNNGNYNNYNDDGSDWSELLNKAMDKIFNSDNSDSSYYSSSSSDDNPDLLARLLRFFISNG